MRRPIPPALALAVACLTALAISGPPSVGQAVAPSPSFAATVAPSGKSIVVTLADASGAPTNPSALGPPPTIAINGGRAVTLADAAWNPNSPAILYPLPQSAPAAQTLSISGGTTAGYWNNLQAPTRYSGSILLDNRAGMTATFSFGQLTPGTYRFAITYPTGPQDYYNTIFTPSPSTQFLLSDSAGTLLQATTIDQTTPPIDYVSQDYGWRYVGTPITLAPGQTSLSLAMTTAGLTPGGPAVALLDAVQLVRTSPDASVSILPTDSVAFSAAAGWAASASGPLPAATSVPVAPPSPTAITPAFVASPKTMGVGYNVAQDSYYGTQIVFSNLASRLGRIGTAQDANGYPTRLASATATYYWIAGPPPTPNGPKGWRNAPSGLYTVQWDGASVLGLNLATSSTITEVASQKVLTGGKGNLRVYNVQAAANDYSPWLALDVAGTGPDPSDPSGETFLCDVSNLRIYPPDPADPTGMTPWANPPKFHPAYVARLAGVRCLRFMDPLGTNNNPLRDFAGYKPTSFADRGSPWIFSRVPIGSISAPAVPSWFPPSATVVEVATTSPHGLFDGQIVSTSGAGSATFADGSTIALDGGNYLVKVVDPTHVLLQIAPNGPNPGAMANTITTGTIVAQSGSLWSLQDIADLVTASGVPELWLNFPVTVDASLGGCVDQVAAFLAANLPAGVKVHVEYGNECWNWGFQTYYWTRALNYQITGQDDGSYPVAYVKGAMAAHQRFDAVFSAAGRPNSTIYTYATQGANAGGPTRSIADAAKAAGARIDEMAVGIYWDNWDALAGIGPTLPGVFDRMTPDHLLDLLASNVEHGRYETFVTAHAPILAAAGYGTTKIVAYEAAPDVLVPPASNANPPNSSVAGGGVVPAYYQRQHAVQRHPRMYGLQLRFLQRMQDAGLAYYGHYTAGSGSGAWAWDAYEGFDQLPGTGNPTLDAANLSDPAAMDQVKAEVGGALSAWAALVPGPISVPVGSTTMSLPSGSALSLPDGNRLSLVNPTVITITVPHIKRGNN